MNDSKLPIITIEGNDLILHPSKALYNETTSTLVVSDLHIGKSAHFRKNGIAIPSLANKNNFWKLVEVIELFNPKRILFLGDVAHSHHNHEWDDFADFLQQYPSIEKLLVLGNHDIMKAEHYVQAGLTVLEELIELGICWMHEAIEDSARADYVISGHIHPSVLLKGAAGQKLNLPCFYFGKKEGLVPAFGEFTGTYKIKPKAEDRVWVIAENKVIEVSKKS